MAKQSRFSLIFLFQPVFSGFSLADSSPLRASRCSRNSKLGRSRCGPLRICSLGCFDLFFRVFFLYLFYFVLGRVSERLTLSTTLGLDPDGASAGGRLSGTRWRTHRAASTRAAAPTSTARGRDARPRTSSSFLFLALARPSIRALSCESWWGLRRHVLLDHAVHSEDL